MAEDKATAKYSAEEIEAMAEHYATSLHPHDRRVAGMLRQGLVAMKARHPDLPTCDTCGEPATHSVSSGQRTQHGCSQHPTKWELGESSVEIVSWR